MNTSRLFSLIGVAAASLVMAGCATKPYNYTNFREHPPRSILVLPPLNESTELLGSYSYLSAVTQPLAEQGYYVFPVAIVDQFMKENGMPTAGEMHQVPLKKIYEILGADSVMYVTVLEYGTKFQILKSVPTVKAAARLVDTRTGILLWEGNVTVVQNSNNSGGGLIGALIVAVVEQAINTTTDRAHALCGQANVILFTSKDTGLLYGPYRPEEVSRAN
ncbi:MAG: GNA1162 family protein [Betaproteobacteria bacterium]